MFFYWIRSLASSLIRLMEFLIFLRAILSWIPQARDSSFAAVLYQLTEPVISPFRRLLSRVEALRAFPLDLSVLAAFLALEAVEVLLYSL